MKSGILTALIGSLAVHAACATQINIDLGPDRIVRGQHDGFILFPFNDLAGTPLNGQTLSLDFDFGDSFVRAFPITDRLLQFYAIGRTTRVLSNGENDTIALGYVLPLWGLTGGMVFEGIHMEYALPDMPGVELLDGHLLIMSNLRTWYPYAIGNAKPVPDGGATLGMLAVAVSCLAGVMCHRRRSHD